MNSFLNYSVYFFTYGLLFLLFLKGYYPANETSILLIGFLIFMTVAYIFGGAFISSELDSKRKEIYVTLKNLLEQNKQTIISLTTIYNTILKYSGLTQRAFIKTYTALKMDIIYLYSEGLHENVNFEVNEKLIDALRDQLLTTRLLVYRAYNLAVKELLDDRLQIDLE